MCAAWARPYSRISAFSSQARVFLLALVGMAMVVDGIYAVLLNLYLLRLGYGTEFIGLVNAAGLLTFAAASLPAGILGARYSNTAMMKSGAALSALGACCLPLAEALPGSLTEAWLVGSYALMLVGFSFFFVNGAPFLLNVVAVEQKHRAFSLKTAAWALAGFAGSLLGGVLPGLLAAQLQASLDHPAPYRLTLQLASSLMVLAALLLLWRIRPLPVDTPAPRQANGKAAQPQNWSRALLTLIAIMTIIRLFQVAGSATAMVYFNVYMDQQLLVATATIGSIAAIGRLTGVPTALLTPRLVRRWGEVSVIIGSSLVTALCLLPMALVEHWLAAALGYIGTLALTSIRYTAFVVYILDLVPKAQQSVMAGSGEMAAGLSFSMMALGGGLLLTLFAFRDLFLMGAVLSLLGTLLFWLYVILGKSRRRSNRR
ncbi:MAG: MFS transporter [Chloroflexi bacterium]|nr:MFS transporter [Chloroflexota bacterium]